MSFGRHTVIQPADPEAGPVLPNYQCLASIPRVVNHDDKFAICVSIPLDHVNYTNLRCCTTYLISVQKNFHA